ncbi:MAG: M56 family metallopeptidase, partial [Pirellulales bacterium]
MTSPTLERISELGLAQLWQVTVLAMVVGLIVRLGCRHRPHLAYLLWMLVLVKCLVPPLAASRLSPFSWLLAQRVEQAAGRAVIPATIALAANDPVTGTTTGDAAIAAAMPAAVAAPSIDLVALASAIVLALWAAGATALALLVVAKHVKLRRAIRQASAPPPRLTQQLELLAQRLGVRRPPALVVTDEPLGPLVCGLLRPTIVLPATALQTAGEQAEDAIDLESVLAHELVHVRRGDTIVSLLQTVAQAVWWFHPLVWWANRELRRQRERSCDEEVIAGLGCRPTRYARSLLAVLEVRPRPSKSWALAGVPMLSFTAQRLAHLVREQATFRRRTPRGYWAIAIALVVVLIPGAGLSLEAPPNENAKKDPPEKPATWTTASGDVTTLEITGTLVAGDAVLADEGDDAQITGHFIAAPQTPVPAGEIGSDAQRAAVAELEKLGGAVYAARDKAGQIHMTVILERDKWKGGSAGLAQ